MTVRWVWRRPGDRAWRRWRRRANGGSELASLVALKRLDVQTNRLTSLGDGEDGGTALAPLGGTLEELSVTSFSDTARDGSGSVVGVAHSVVRSFVCVCLCLFVCSGPSVRHIRRHPTSSH